VSDGNSTNGGFVVLVLPPPPHGGYVHLVWNMDDNVPETKWNQIT
jgi:hypothetical protein